MALSRTVRSLGQDILPASCLVTLWRWGIALVPQASRACSGAVEVSFGGYSERKYRRALRQAKSLLLSEKTVPYDYFRGPIVNLGTENFTNPAAVTCSRQKRVHRSYLRHFLQCQIEMSCWARGASITCVHHVIYGYRLGIGKCPSLRVASRLPWPLVMTPTFNRKNICIRYASATTATYRSY